MTFIIPVRKIIRKFPRLRTTGVRCVNYIKNPRALKTDLLVTCRLPFARRMGIEYISPNYIFFDRFDQNSVVIDVGCGYEADFSQYLMKRYGVKVFAVDPTQKHAESLKNIEQNFKGQFRHIPAAISHSQGTITFFETCDNESGSTLKDHKNIINDTVISYPVASYSLTGMLEQIERREVDLIKLDIEGAEYQLLESVTKNDLQPFKQIFVEFHHPAIASLNRTHTKKIVNHICRLGYDVFTLDFINYLFYKHIDV